MRNSFLQITAQYQCFHVLQTIGVADLQQTLQIPVTK